MTARRSRRRPQSAPAVPAAPALPWIQAASPAAVGILSTDRLTPAEPTRWGSLVPAKPSPAFIRTILDAALAGDVASQADLFDLMLDTWPRLRKAMHEICSAVSRVRYHVNPAAPKEGVDATPEAEDRADLVRRSLGQWSPTPGTDESGFEDTIYDLAQALGSGVSAVELLWEQNAEGMHRPRAGCNVPMRLLRWDNETGRLMLQAGDEAHLLTAPKFLVGAHKTRSGPAIGWGLFRPLAWWWCAAQWGREWLLSYSQVFGQPFRWVNHSANMNGADLSKLDAMLANMGAQGWARFPEGVTLSYIESRGSAGQDSPQRVLLDLADKVCDILILGQTLTTDVGDSGSRALGNVHEGVRRERVQQMSQWVADVINYQLVPSLCQLNYGAATDCPIVAPDFTETPDPDKLAERIGKWVDVGVEVPLAWAHEQTGVPRPRNGEPVLQRKIQPAAVPPGTPGDPGADPKDLLEEKESPSGEVASQLSLHARMADALAVPAAWLNPIRQWIRSVEARMEDGGISDADLVTELEAARRRLPEVFAAMDHEALAEVIASSSQRAASRVDRRAAAHG